LCPAAVGTALVVVAAAAAAAASAALSHLGYFDFSRLAWNLRWSELLHRGYSQCFVVLSWDETVSCGREGFEVSCRPYVSKCLQRALSFFPTILLQPWV
jgi:hypothetical protein